MNKGDFERYNEVSTIISNKHAEYKESVKDLAEEKDQIYKQIIQTSKDLLIQTRRVLDKIIGNRFGTGWTAGKKDLVLFLHLLNQKDSIL